VAYHIRALFDSSHELTQNSLIAREVYALSFIIGRMDAPEQAIWLAEHIPHRVRAAIARLPMESSILRVTATIDPKCLTEQQKIYWRCAADSIWEGRLAATRWLIEFVGIKQGKAGNPVRCEKDPKYPDDVHIDDFDGGVPLNHLTPEAVTLANVWKGSSQASSHATSGAHPDVRESSLANALAVVAEHLQNTIYQKAGKVLRDYVLEPVR
jgi:hypothetical protein